MEFPAVRARFWSIPQTLSHQPVTPVISLLGLLLWIRVINIYWTPVISSLQCGLSYFIFTVAPSQFPYEAGILIVPRFHLREPQFGWATWPDQVHTAHSEWWGLFVASCEGTTGHCQGLLDCWLLSHPQPASFILFLQLMSKWAPHGGTQKHISPLLLPVSSVVCYIMSPALSFQYILTTQSRPETPLHLVRAFVSLAPQLMLPTSHHDHKKIPHFY